MNKDQFFGLLRELMTAIGAALVTWGVGETGLWQEISGGLMAVVGIGWALSHHEERGMVLTLVRKLISAVAGVAVATGVLTPEKSEVMMGVAGSLVTLVWSMWEKGGTPPAVPVWVLFASLACLSMTSCSVAYDPAKGWATSVDPVAVSAVVDRLNERLTEKLNEKVQVPAPPKGRVVEIEADK